MKLSARFGENVHEVAVRRTGGVYIVEVEGKEHRIDARKLESDFYSIVFGGKSYEVSVEADGDRYFVRHGAYEQVVELTDPGRRARGALTAGDGPQEIAAVMPGKVVRLLVSPGDEVQEGQGVVVVEAMKMENEIGAPKAGTVVSIDVETGQAVETGTRLAVVG